MNENTSSNHLNIANLYENSAQLLTIASVGIAINCISLNTAYAAGIVGNGTAISCTETALNQALTNGGNVTFKCGNNPVNISISSEKVISANTVIDGSSLIILNGNNSRRLFKMQGRIQFTIKNTTLANGYTTDQGAAINNASQGNLNIINCLFTNNIATKTGEYGGGAIFSGPMGAVTIDRTTFNNNKGSIGGAIRILNSNLTVTNSIFTSNKAVGSSLGNGGAIYVDGANGDNGYITIRSSTFSYNTATAYGGALFNNIYNNNKTTIENSIFSNNTVGGGSNGQGAAIWSTGDPSSGGGIWLSNSNKTTLTISNTTISNNTATNQGGGIWLARHPQGITINNSTIAGNIAKTSNGGGIVLGDNGKLTITNSTISGNKVLGNYSLAGGIFISNVGRAIITNSTIAGNEAYWQAGGIFGGSNVTLKNTIIANNVAKNGGNNWNIKHNCMNQMTNGGNNLQFPARNMLSNQDVDCVAGILTADPKLDILRNNGGLTQTRAILSGSAASRKGAGCPAMDQRGITRPQPAGTACDIGAFEAAY